MSKTILCDVPMQKIETVSYGGTGNAEIKYATTVAIILRGVTIFADSLLKGSTINIFIIIVAIVHIGAVIKSANPPPIAAAASAYGRGNNAAAK